MPKKKYRNIEIHPLCGGFILEIGSFKLAVSTADEMMNYIRRYIQDPEAMEKELDENNMSRNGRRGIADFEYEAPPIRTYAGEDIEPVMQEAPILREPEPITIRIGNGTVDRRPVHQSIARQIETTASWVAANSVWGGTVSPPAAATIEPPPQYTYVGSAQPITSERW